MARKRFLLGLVLIAVSAMASAATTVPAWRFEGIWVVQGTVSGRPAYFIVDTGADHTALLPDSLLREGVLGVDIKIGDFSTHVEAYVMPMDFMKVLEYAVSHVKKEPQFGSAKPVIAVLSTDVLSGLALGLDKDKGEITIWPGGKLESKTALDWVGQNGGTEKPARLEITKFFEQRPAVPIKFGDSSGWAVFDTGAYNSAVRPSFDKKFGTLIYKSNNIGLDTTPSEIRLISEATLAGIETPWLQFTANSVESTVKGKPDGVVSLNDIPSRRILIDLPGKATYYSPADRDGMLANTLSRMLDVPVAFDGKGLKIGKVTPEYEDALKPFENCPIEFIAGHQASEVAMAFRAKPDSTKLFIEALAIRLRKEFSILITYKEKTFELRAHPG